jgi:Uri superfamily endonuclease
LNGIYSLEISLSKGANIRVGALGNVYFREGSYMYVGSAQRNLEKRVQRHLRKEKKLFWHIDYFLSSEHAKIEKVFFRQADKLAECEIAQELGRRGEPVPWFGCSDCRCQSHLFWFPRSSSVQELDVFAASQGWATFDAYGESVKAFML